MKTSPADSPASAPTLIVFAEAGAIGGWRLLGGGAGIVGAGAGAVDLPAPPARTLLVVPGEQVAIHWIELADGLTPAQAAAAARLMLADACAEPGSSLHVAVGRPEQGLTPVALVPQARMAEWLAAAQSAGLDPDSVVPAPMLLAPPKSGFVRRRHDGLADYRAAAAAFTIEPELAGEIVGAAAVAELDEAGYAAGLATAAAAPALDLRQGAFARRRRWKLESRRLRRALALLLVFAALTLAVQLGTLLRYTFEADRLRAEADALAARSPAADSRLAFGAAAAILFDAVRATPNVELVRIEYGADGLGAAVTIDSPATFALLRQRIEASGLTVVAGATTATGGRQSADFRVQTPVGRQS